MRSALRVKRWLDRGWELPALVANAKHCRCFWLLAAQRSMPSTEAQQEVFSLVIAAPEPIRARFRGQKLAAMLDTAASLRVHSSWDTETTSTIVALRTLARRAHAISKRRASYRRRSWP